MRAFCCASGENRAEDEVFVSQQKGTMFSNFHGCWDPGEISPSHDTKWDGKPAVFVDF